MRTTRSIVVAFALLAAACSAKAAGPPEIVIDGTACSHCGMLVSELTYAAAYQARGEAARVFDDIGCMVEAMRREKAASIAAWVQDAGGGGWIDADAAVFVAAPDIRTPMNGGVLAYADRQGGEAASTAHGRRLIGTLAELIARDGDLK
jgi:nitrous oxide reductase accessory protein NosL